VNITTRRKIGYIVGIASYRAVIILIATVLAMLIAGIPKLIFAVGKTISLLESEATMIMERRTDDLILLAAELITSAQPTVIIAFG